MLPDALIRWLMWALVVACLCGMSFFKGCEYAKADYKEAETKFIERVKVVKEIERVEVPKLVTKIQWLDHTETRYLEDAKNAAPNPMSCDIDPDRVRRYRLAATGNPD